MSAESSPHAGPTPGQPPLAPPPTVPPVQYRPAEPSAPVGWVIAAMIVFWPTGIPALLASHRAARAFGAADTDVALRESANARRWGIISVCVGAGLVVLSLVASVLWFVVVAFALHASVDDDVWDRGPGWSSELPADPDRPGMLDRRDSDR